MITCNNCGRVNDESTRICRFCGTVLGYDRPQPSGTQERQYAPPAAAGPTGFPPNQQPVAPYNPPGVATGAYRCPNCGSNYPPIVESRISQEGLIVFIALLVFCLPLFWIGLLMKEEQRICPTCRARIA